MARSSIGRTATSLRELALLSLTFSAAVRASGEGDGDESKIKQGFAIDPQGVSP